MSFLEENLLKIDLKGRQAMGMDVVIISASTPQLENFWQERLERTRGEVTKSHAYVLAIYEDWPGGAGNGLGSLYSFLKARQKAYQLYHIDLYKKLRDGASIAIYHTAGQGSRLSPLTSSEHNDKSAIKLPSLLKNDQYVTLVEAVIKQTSIYAPSRHGRLSIFWGDQIFIPSNEILYTPKHHIDILSQLFRLPSEQKWQARGLSHYGLLALHDGDAQDIDKNDYRTIQRLIQEHKILTDEGIAISLGSFSLSAAMTFALLEEFSLEMQRKHIKMDSDPFIWMPLTLDLDTYMEVMAYKQVPAQFAARHYERIKQFKKRFAHAYPELNLFGAVDIGSESYWWDYGTVQSYFANNLKLTGNDQESELMRQFYHNPLHASAGRGSILDIDNHSCILNSQIRSGRIVNSVVVGVYADEVNIENCVIINSVAARIFAHQCLFYNLLEEGEVHLPDQSVRADCVLLNKIIKMQTTLKRDGKEDWNKHLFSNSLSYEELSQQNAQLDLQQVLKRRQEARKDLIRWVRNLPVR